MKASEVTALGAIEDRVWTWVYRGKCPEAGCGVTLPPQVTPDAALLDLKEHAAAVHATPRDIKVEWLYLPRSVVDVALHREEEAGE